MAADGADLERVAAIFDELTEAGVADLDASRARVEVRLAVDMRYVGQAHELTVDGPGDRRFDRAWLAELRSRFRDRYRVVYGSAHEGPVELVSFRARVILPVARAAPGGDERPGGGARTGSRPAWSSAHAGFVPTPLYDRSRLRCGDRLAGPAIIEAPDATVVVPDGWEASVEPASNLVLERQAAGAGAGPERR
jgi:N-methylhydantoinase A